MNKKNEQLMKQIIENGALIYCYESEYVKDNIRINSVCPGIFDTAILNGLLQEQIKELSAQVAMGYIGKPIDMAYLTLFLTSDESKYITGQSILIDGGRYVTSFFYL